jgi:DNA-binding PadR family transcriptional regulator
MSDERFFKRQINVRGMLVLWIIFLLQKRSMSGYEIIKEIKSSTSHWKPTTGAIYPTLHMLKKNGLIKIEEKGKRKKKIYSLTKEGKIFFKKTSKKIIEKFRDSNIRRIIDSFLWPDEPVEIREMFNKLFISIFDLRNYLKGKYNNYAIMKKTESKIKKIIRQLQI